MSLSWKWNPKFQKGKDGSQLILLSLYIDSLVEDNVNSSGFTYPQLIQWYSVMKTSTVYRPHNDLTKDMLTFSWRVKYVL